MTTAGIKVMLFAIYILIMLVFRDVFKYDVFSAIIMTITLVMMAIGGLSKGNPRAHLTHNRRTTHASITGTRSVAPKGTATEG